MYPEFSIIGFDKSRLLEIYRLVEDVYTTSGTMSELFSEKFPGPESCGEYIEEVLGKPGAVVLFAETGGKLVGYIILKPRPHANIRHTAELNMGVKPGFRGKHAGTSLLSKTLGTAKRSKEVEIIYLMVRADNYPAVRLYENAGFEKLATLERDTKISGIYYDGILMRKFV